MWLHCVRMKSKFFAVIAGLVIVTAGCVDTVSGRKTAAVPWVKDSIEGRYERPAAQVYDAAKSVLALNGTLLNETTIHGTNAVFALEGRVNQRSVWISVTQVEPKISSVVVQARTKAGGTDIELVHELEKQIALKLVK